MDPEKLKALIDFSRQMVETRELNPLLESAMSMALGFVGAEFGYIVLLDNEDLVFRVGLDENGNSLQEPQEQISRTIFDEVIQSGKSSIVEDALESFESSSVMSLKIRSVMCTPLISRGNILGAIYVENRSERNLFEEDDLELLENFAALAAVSIENTVLIEDLDARVEARTNDLARANVRLHELSITDSLTGIFNRHHFFDLAEKELLRAERHQRHLSVVMIDLDHFKKVNDEFGHQVGDQVLQAVATRIHKNIRTIDIFGRYGGEEFVLLFPDTDLSSATKMAERLLALISAQPIDTQQGQVQVTISLGVAGHDPAKRITLDTLLDCADQALYDAKKAGRNQISIYC